MTSYCEVCQAFCFAPHSHPALLQNSSLTCSVPPRLTSPLDARSAAYLPRDASPTQQRAQKTDCLRGFPSDALKVRARSVPVPRTSSRAQHRRTRDPYVCPCQLRGGYNSAGDNDEVIYRGSFDMDPSRSRPPRGWRASTPPPLPLATPGHVARRIMPHCMNRNIVKDGDGDYRYTTDTFNSWQRSASATPVSDFLRSRGGATGRRHPSRPPSPSRRSSSAPPPPPPPPLAAARDFLDHFPSQRVMAHRCCYPSPHRRPPGSAARRDREASSPTDARGTRAGQLQSSGAARLSCTTAAETGRFSDGNTSADDGVVPAMHHDLCRSPLQDHPRTSLGRSAAEGPHERRETNRGEDLLDTNNARCQHHPQPDRSCLTHLHHAPFLANEVPASSSQRHPSTSSVQSAPPPLLRAEHRPSPSPPRSPQETLPLNPNAHREARRGPVQGLQSQTMHTSSLLPPSMQKTSAVPSQRHSSQQRRSSGSRAAAAVNALDGTPSEHDVPSLEHLIARIRAEVSKDATASSAPGEPHLNTVQVGFEGAPAKVKARSKAKETERTTAADAPKATTDETATTLPSTVHDSEVSAEKTAKAQRATRRSRDAPRRTQSSGTRSSTSDDERQEAKFHAGSRKLAKCETPSASKVKGKDAQKLYKSPSPSQRQFKQAATTGGASATPANVQSRHPSSSSRSSTTPSPSDRSMSSHSSSREVRGRHHFSNQHEEPPLRSASATSVTSSASNEMQRAVQEAAAVLQRMRRRAARHREHAVEQPAIVVPTPEPPRVTSRTCGRDAPRKSSSKKSRAASYASPTAEVDGADGRVSPIEDTLSQQEALMPQQDRPKQRHSSKRKSSLLFLSSTAEDAKGLVTPLLPTALRSGSRSTHGRALQPDCTSDLPSPPGPATEAAAATLHDTAAALFAQLERRQGNWEAAQQHQTERLREGLSSLCVAVRKDLRTMRAEVRETRALTDDVTTRVAALHAAVDAVREKELHERPSALPVSRASPARAESLAPEVVVSMVAQCSPADQQRLAQLLLPHLRPALSETIRAEVQAELRRARREESQLQPSPQQAQPLEEMEGRLRSYVENAVRTEVRSRSHDMMEKLRQTLDEEKDRDAACTSVAPLWAQFSSAEAFHAHLRATARAVLAEEDDRRYSLANENERRHEKRVRELQQHWQETLREAQHTWTASWRSQLDAACERTVRRAQAPLQQHADLLQKIVKALTDDVTRLHARQDAQATAVQEALQAERAMRQREDAQVSERVERRVRSMLPREVEASCVRYHVQRERAVATAAGLHLNAGHRAASPSRGAATTSGPIPAHSTSAEELRLSVVQPALDHMRRLLASHQDMMNAAVEDRCRRAENAVEGSQHVWLQNVAELRGKLSALRSDVRGAFNELSNVLNVASPAL